MAFTVATTKNNRSTKAQPAQEESEYAGLWINVGVLTQNEAAEGEEPTTHFNRLPRGIAVADFVDHKIYANSNPDWRCEAELVNEIMAYIREKGLTLEEGESIPINLSVRLYRRQEQVEPVKAKINPGLKAQLFEV